ncbi:MAG TPA: LecA/PA-IL family lectin [Blastocatellia bacterium]|nr:LecA/PA-IL family lectin [Blastocatellia bacterium]
MRKAILMIMTLVLVTLLTGVLRADTLYLQDGSVLQGTFVGYENGYFLFIINSGDENARPLRFEARRVKRLVIDRNTTTPGNPPPQQPDRSRGNFETFPPFNVSLTDQWMKSDVQVARGQRVRVEASGRMYLDGRTESTPDGINRRDPDAPLPNENDGALVAAIGTDPNSPVILIGRSREFTADRDGVLYFTVNHWDTSNARGSYQVRVSVERSTGTGTVPTDPNRNWSERTVTIPASRQWTDTGLDVEPGMTIEITATGTINISYGRRVDAGGDTSRSGTSSLPVPNAATGALIGKIRYRQGGESNIVVIGTVNRVTVEPGEYGRLWLGINDDYTGDNSGSFSVRLRYAKP